MVTSFLEQGNKGKLFKGTWYPGGPSVLSITNLAESGNMLTTPLIRTM